MKVSAGIALLWEDRILLAHAKNAPWFRSYTPPKGGVEEGEELIDAAVREFYEEVGISVEKSKLQEPIEVPYIDNKGKTYKRVILFPYRIESVNEVGLEDDKVPSHQLQVEEVDEARFMDAEEFKTKVLPRYYEPLKNLLEKC